MAIAPTVKMIRPIFYSMCYTRYSCSNQHQHLYPHHRNYIRRRLHRRSKFYHFNTYHHDRRLYFKRPHLLQPSPSSLTPPLIISFWRATIESASASTLGYYVAPIHERRKKMAATTPASLFAFLHLKPIVSCERT